MATQTQSDYYDLVRSYSGTMKLIAHYVSMGLQINHLPKSRLDGIYSIFVVENEAALTDLFWQHDDLKMALQNFIKNPTNKNVGNNLLQMLAAKNHDENYRLIAELFEETEKHFKPQASNDDAIELALFNKDMAGFVNQIITRS